MRHKCLKLSSLLFLFLGLTVLQAQEAIPITGGDASGSGGSAGYSLGQVIYTTHMGTSGSITQGVQQPYEISVVSGIQEAKEINLMVTVYPNPTTRFLTLKIDVSTSLNVQALSYQLYNVNGSLLESKKIESNETNITMSELLPATYFLRVMENKREMKNFKILKK